MPAADPPSTVLTIRLDPRLKSSLDREADRRGTTRSELVRELLADGIGGGREGTTLEDEARRQSLLVSVGDTEGEALDFLEQVADTRGWT